MEFIITLLLLFVICFILKVLYEEKKSKQNTGIYYATNTIYVAGFNDTEGGKDIVLNVEMDCLHFKFANKDKIIPMASIKNCSIKSEHQIQKEISLGKIILFGIFSLGMSKNKTIVNNFLVITHKDIDGEKSILLQSKNLEELNKKINEVLRRQYA